MSITPTIWRRNLDVPHREVMQCHDELHYDPSRRTVLLFPGINVVEGSGSQAVGGMIKNAERLLKGKGTYTDPIDPCDIYCIKYSGTHGPGEVRSHYTGRGQYHHDAKGFVAYGLIPLLNENGQEGTLERPLSIDELKERLSHITVIGHSYGGVFAREVARELYGTLSRVRGEGGKKKYSQEELADALRQVVNIPIANTSVLHETGRLLNHRRECAGERRSEFPGFSNVAFTASNDAWVKAQLMKRGMEFVQHLNPWTDGDTILNPQSEAVRLRKVERDKAAQKAGESVLAAAGYVEGYRGLRVQRQHVVANDMLGKPHEGGRSGSTVVSILVTGPVAHEISWKERVQVDDKDGLPFGEQPPMVVRTVNEKNAGSAGPEHDLRVHTIPSEGFTEYPMTVRRVVRNAITRDVDFKNLHTEGGKAEGLATLLEHIPDSNRFPPRPEYLCTALIDEELLSQRLNEAAHRRPDRSLV